MEHVRSPICTVVGHVDHGKSTFLDTIRGTSIVEDEPGRITQAIGASIIPLDTIRKLSGNLFEKLKMSESIQGLLFIDTPGHAAFTNLRKRGGTLADLAILMIDINEGFKPQTVEAIEILKQFKVPFIVAANKIDLLPGWKPANAGQFTSAIIMQSEKTLQLLDQKLYELVGKLYEYGFNSERFDRVTDYTKQLAIVPISAKGGIGIPETLMTLMGLAQRYLEKRLALTEHGPARGTILEVKEAKGTGCCLDVVIYDGVISVNDMIVIGGIDSTITTKIRAIFEPSPLSETRDKKSKFNSVRTAMAATAVRIIAPGIDDAIAGMPLRSTTSENLEQTKTELLVEIKEVLIQTDKDGIVIKADTLGSLEALMTLLRTRNIPIRKAAVGNISKKDITDAEGNYERDPLSTVILGFNVSVMQDVFQSPKVKILTSNIIYRLIEDYESWKLAQAKSLESGELDKLARPCKIELMRNYVFRQSNPAIMGVEVLAGKLRVGAELLKDGMTITSVRSIQLEKENVSSAEQGKQVAVSMDGVTIGRQINEGDILYSAIPEDHYRKLKELKKHLSSIEIELMKEIAAIMRKDNPVWGV